MDFSTSARRFIGDHLSYRNRVRLKKAFGLKPFDRIIACNDLLAARPGETAYLEIGVARGHVISVIDATYRYGVDPKPAPAILDGLLRTEYFAFESDSFFADYAPKVFAERKIDVALVDGLHEYAQTLRDVENTLLYLRDHGVIVMHDCNPPSWFRGLPPNERRAEAKRRRSEGKAVEGAWEGDTWKAVVHLRAARDDVDVCVLDCDHGLGIVVPKRPESRLDLSPTEEAGMSYEDLARDRERLLNLKPASHFKKILQRVRASA